VIYLGGVGTFGGASGVLPDTISAQVLMDAIKSDSQIVVTGDPGGGAIAGDDVVEETPTPSATPTTAPTIGPEPPPVVELPSNITGQQATQKTCTNGNTF